MDGSIDISGIFDEHYAQGAKDGGNVTQQFKRPRFIVNEKLSITPNTSTLQVRSIDYIIVKQTGNDYNGMNILWLRPV